jgi:thiol-disulfide isomerase/thioredoxin
MRGAIPKLERITGLALLGVGAWTLAAAVAELPPAQTEQACELAGAGHTCALGDLAAVQAAGEEIQIALDQPQFLEFSAHDCPVCRRMRPVVEKLAASCSELEARIVRVDVSTRSGRALAARFNVRGTPTFVLLNEHGVEALRLLGESTGEQLAAAVEQAFGVSCWG